MRFFIILFVLIVSLMLSPPEVTVQALWMDIHSPIAILLVVIIVLLLHQQFHKRDFYAVEQFAYNLNFIEGTNSSGRATMRVERGPMLYLSCKRTVFSDYAAAKVSFDHQEKLTNGNPVRNGTEAIHRVYVVSASRKPADALLKDDKYRGPWLHHSPISAMYVCRREARDERLAYVRRREAGDERLANIENERDMAKLMASCTHSKESSDIESA